MPLPFDASTFAIAAAVTFASYVLFGITAFGASLFTTSLLSHFYPLEFVLPLCVLLDVSAALALGRRFSRDADRGELAWLTPFSLIGAVLGVTLLVTLPRAITLCAFGVFLLVYGVTALREGPAPARVSRRWAPLSGLTGGAMGTLFGIGAPPYAIYLNRRIEDKNALRSTLSNMVLLSTSIRALVFLGGGLMLADRLIAFAMLLPLALAGLWVGNRLHDRVSRTQVTHIVSVLLLAIGGSLIVRAAGA